MDAEFPNLRHLRAFSEVAALSSISAAAERVHLSQPAVTQAVARLEERVSVPLFERRAGGMFTTDYGTALRRRVERALSHLSLGAEKALRRSGNGSDQFPRQVTATQLRALSAIARFGSFSLAARRLAISQPSVHRAARDLERLAGLSLFKASSRGVDLTVPAEILARHTNLAAAELRQGFDEVAAMRGQDSTHIFIGSMPLARTEILPQAIHNMLRDRSTVQIRNIDGPYAELLRGLRQGEIDFLIGAMRNPVPADDVVQEPLFDDPLTVVARPSHPLASRTSVALEDTLDYPWIAPPKDTPAGTYLSEVLRISELPNTPVRVVSSSLIIVTRLLTLGDYVTLISPNQIDPEIRAGNLVPLKVDLPQAVRSIGLTFREGWVPTPTQDVFLELVRAACP